MCYCETTLCSTLYKKNKKTISKWGQLKITNMVANPNPKNGQNHNTNPNST